MSLRATASSGLEALSSLNADGSTVTWFQSQWPFFSWAIFLFGSGYLAATCRTRNDHWYGWLSVVMYCLHQSEEHAYDLRGWRYAFVPSLNFGPIAKMYEEACEGKSPTICPLDPKITLYVNVAIIWIGFGGCMVAATLAPRRFLFAGTLNWGTAVVNGIGGHILPAVVTSTYNPGVVQSIFMVPIGIYVMGKSGRLWLCVASGILNHIALIVGINIIYRFQTDEAVTMTALILAASLILPLAISNYVSLHGVRQKSK